MLLLAPGAFVWGSSQPVKGNGLETDSTEQLRVLIEELSEDAKKIGLTRDRIEARVNQSVRKSGITPVVPGPVAFGSSGGELYVSVSVSGYGFCITMFFVRRVFYNIGDRWFTYEGNTWHSLSIGYSREADYILDVVGAKVEGFCNEFLRANGK